MSGDPLDFAAEDTFGITGRGTDFTGPAPFRMSREHTEILWRLVRIKGRLYRVWGVERRLSADPVIHAGEPIGLLVEPVPDVSPPVGAPAAS